MVKNASDITQLSEAMSLGLGVISALIKSSVFLYNRKLIGGLLIDLQRIIDASKIKPSYQCISWFPKFEIMPDMKYYNNNTFFVY